MDWWRHLVVLSAAIAITVVGLGFWIVFSHAVGNYLSREAAPPQTVQNPNEVTVKIVCTKANPCRTEPRPHE